MVSISHLDNKNSVSLILLLDDIQYLKCHIGRPHWDYCIAYPYHVHRTLVTISLTSSIISSTNRLEPQKDCWSVDLQLKEAGNAKYWHWNEWPKANWSTIPPTKNLYLTSFENSSIRVFFEMHFELRFCKMKEPACLTNRGWKKVKWG